MGLYYRVRHSALSALLHGLWRVTVEKLSTSCFPSAEVNVLGTKDSRTAAWRGEKVLCRCMGPRGSWEASGQRVHQGKPFRWLRIKGTIFRLGLFWWVKFPGSSEVLTTLWRDLKCSLYLQEAYTSLWVFKETAVGTGVTTVSSTYRWGCQWPEMKKCTWDTQTVMSSLGFILTEVPHWNPASTQATFLWWREEGSRLLERYAGWSYFLFLCFSFPV